MPDPFPRSSTSPTALLWSLSTQMQARKSRDCSEAHRKRCHLEEASSQKEAIFLTNLCHLPPSTAPLIYTGNRGFQVSGFVKSDPGSEELRAEPGWMDRIISYHLESPAGVPPLLAAYYFHMMSLSLWPQKGGWGRGD